MPLEMARRKTSRSRLLVDHFAFPSLKNGQMSIDKVHCYASHVGKGLLIPSLVRSLNCFNRYTLVNDMATQIPKAAERRSAARYSSSFQPNPDEHLALVCASPLFIGLSERECAEIISCSRVLTYARNELLYAQGNPMRSLIFLQTGCVKHTQLGESGEEVLLWMSGSGEALNVQPPDNTSRHHSCTARAMERCHTLVWEYARLEASLHRYPQIRMNISQILASRLKELEERFREIATEKVATRLALMLLRLLKQVGKVSPEGTQIFMSREELAQMTGTTLFTISRILSKWAEKGFAVPRREAILICNPRGLESVANEDAA
jgi:CRP/FNR family transcriptional regulator, nitrogen oxide reductase regulator